VTDDAAHLGDSLATLTQIWDSSRPYNLGFPGATDFDYSDLGAVLARQLLNNVGDPWTDGLAANHTKAAERAVVEFLADLFRAPADDRWGYVTAGGSEGNLYGLYLGRRLHPDGFVYHSDAAHPSIDKAIDVLGLPSVRIRTDRWGQLDYADFGHQIQARRDRAVVVAASIGTTMTEAVDDVRTISGLLDDLAIRRRFIHADAALSGVPLALFAPDERPGFDFADGADCLTISGHKFIGCPMPCGVVLTRASLRHRVGGSGQYVGSPDTTISGSRSGHTPLLLWHRLQALGLDGLRARAEQSRELAAYAYERLIDIGWPAHRFPHAFTVVLRTPPEAGLRRWVLASTNGWSHLITMPGVTAEQIDAFVADLVAALPTVHDGQPSPSETYTDPTHLIPHQLSPAA
jgi:histidine decarboxylase